MFEDSLKLAASLLSNKTEASVLVQLMRTTAFIDNQELSEKLGDYLKVKASTLSNEELSQVYASLVLLKKNNPKLLKLLEYLTLRRIHGLQPSEISKIISSYTYLCLQGKQHLSSSFIKTFEYVIMNKVSDLDIT